MNAKVVSPLARCPIKIRSPRLRTTSRNNAPKLSSGRYIEASDYVRGRQEDGLVLYSHTVCPYAQRVWLALEEKELEYTLVQIDLANKPSWYRSVNPRGLVPAVEYDGTVVTESDEICQWIEENFDGPQLTPSDKDAREFAENIIRQAGPVSHAGLGLLGGSTSHMWGVGSSPTDAQISAFESSLNVIEEGFDRFGGPYLVGNKVTLADISIFPFIERFALAFPEFSGYDPRECCNGKLGAWLDTMQNQKASQVTMANRDLLLDALRSHKSLDFFDYVTYPISRLHPHISVTSF
ncbi:hypothetical protein BSKO_07925 [Bryopsis sp. KO-2023]|nr:hypothetical protein BSKO_07925 [Bryopsis sp. KO-2023]